MTAPFAAVNLKATIYTRHLPKSEMTLCYTSNLMFTIQKYDEFVKMLLVLCINDMLLSNI